MCNSLRWDYFLISLCYWEVWEASKKVKKVFINNQIAQHIKSCFTWYFFSQSSYSLSLCNWEILKTLINVCFIFQFCYEYEFWIKLIPIYKKTSHSFSNKKVSSLIVGPKPTSGNNRYPCRLIAIIRKRMSLLIEVVWA